MPEHAPCPFRYIYKGRTFCAIAIRDRRYTTAEVVPSACGGCRARAIVDEVRCAHLNMGVEVDQYGGAHDVNVYYASCEKLVERLSDFGQCGQDRCPHWEPMEMERVAALRQEALADQKEKELASRD
ncbi:MAG: hypothetical protein HPY44_05290 [Armatimonadetes bacterium]|nr:hypothetical protein [Armatimonadota bacterium]